MDAQAARETLGEDAVDGRRDEVRLDAHLDQPCRRRGRAVGVQRRQHEVAGEGGLDRDPRALAVAHLADHDDVRIGAHDRAQPGLEGQPRALEDLHLLDAGQAVLDGVLDRHDRLLRRADDGDRCIQRGRLARARRPGREDRAVRAAQRPVDARAVGVAHAELAERQRTIAGIEDPHDRRLAVDERHDRHADVDAAAVEREARAAVLRQPALGDVEVRQDLDARDDARGLAAGDARGRGHDPVDAVAHLQVAVVGIEVHVGRALLDRLRDERAHELRGRPVVGGRLQRRRRLELLGLGLGVLGVDELLLELAEAQQQHLEVVARDDDRLDAQVGQHRQVVEREDVRRIRHRDDQRLVVAEADRDRLQAAQRRLGHELHRGDVGVQLVEAHVLQPEALGDGQRQLIGVDQAAFDQQVLHRAARGARVTHDLLDRRTVDEAEVDEHIAQQAAGTGAGTGLVNGDVDRHAPALSAASTQIASARRNRRRPLGYRPVYGQSAVRTRARLRPARERRGGRSRPARARQHARNLGRCRVQGAADDVRADRRLRRRHRARPRRTAAAVDPRHAAARAHRGRRARPGRVARRAAALARDAVARRHGPAHRRADGRPLGHRGRAGHDDVVRAGAQPGGA